jgi:ABC-type oligopeptide transport system substrate-binding subunit
MKKVFAFAAVAAFAVAVVSCGQKAENTSAEETPVVEQQEVVTDTLDTTMPADTVQY